MIFTPTLKRKRGASIKLQTELFPQCKPDKQFIGIFTSFSVEVDNPEQIRLLYDGGCFGKGSKSRSCPEFIKQKVIAEDVPRENLILDLEESFFLAYFLKMLVIKNIDGIALNAEQLICEFSTIKPNFIDCLVGYIYLRSKNWIVKSGTKFGGDFLIYKKGMRFFHASFIVFINRGESQLHRDVKGFQRIAETSDKDVLFLEIIPPPDRSEDILQNLTKYTVSENIIKRFNYSGFVQSK